MEWSCSLTGDIEDPITGDEVAKDVFIIFFQGDQLQQRVRKICAGFAATLYPCPESATERMDMRAQVGGPYTTGEAVDGRIIV